MFQFISYRHSCPLFRNTFHLSIILSWITLTILIRKSLCSYEILEVLNNFWILILILSLILLLFFCYPIITKGCLFLILRGFLLWKITTLLLYYLSMSKTIGSDIKNIFNFFWFINFFRFIILNNLIIFLVVIF